MSTPLTWDELRDADPDDYTIATVPVFLAGREDPWADIDAKKQSLQPLLDLVAADEQRGLGDLPYPSVFSRKWVCAGGVVPDRSEFRSTVQRCSPRQLQQRRGQC